MAENKKSFLLYVDLKATIDQLPDEKAGQLLKLILDYVNDLNPQTNDLLLKIAFEPIRQQLKRDLVKWTDFRQKQAENGLKGGRPKKPKPNPENPSLLEETQKSLNVIVNVTVNEYNRYIDGVNTILNKKFRGTTKDKRQFTARLKEKYTNLLRRK